MLPAPEGDVGLAELVLPGASYPRLGPVWPGMVGLAADGPARRSAKTVRRRSRGWRWFRLVSLLSFSFRRGAASPRHEEGHHIPLLYRESKIEFGPSDGTIFLRSAVSA